MLNFFLWWGIVSVIGTFIALSLIQSGKRNSRKADADADAQRADADAQTAPIK
ncbi:hypothetical protein QN382_23205 [Pseudomonas sp. 10B1]|uniref:hypothetical protein n=1 Tax=unclassified Pseudomonas TaxID=196821 RepID=UPI002B23A2F8|nr:MULTISPECIES: hypothetical protein [unclassified Pseudomonas]MEA9996740.1 hypothetical protein [Pseudomonas sp. AA4]MEB0088907.1 hypothetical protein [Pseudomonas sp. RTI1]MEB0128290.1 hypothetical protein [Pseudomonas sp. CCC1.2]MEB0155891.1 hypothetical protein [Pseudomonas sp. CCC4.3]MEB0221206.1 hypothetical protein [Pseudomonas sp. AB12(2023)]